MVRGKCWNLFCCNEVRCLNRNTSSLIEKKIKKSEATGEWNNWWWGRQWRSGAGKIQEKTRHAITHCAIREATICFWINLCIARLDEIACSYNYQTISWYGTCRSFRCKQLSPKVACHMLKSDRLHVMLASFNDQRRSTLRRDGWNTIDEKLRAKMAKKV